MKDSPSEHRTTIAIAVGISAFIGAIAGAGAAVIITGAAQGSFFLGSAIVQEPVMTEQQVEQEIIELIEEESATIAVVERVTPAVVSIVIEVERGSLLPSELDFFDPYFFPSEPLTEEEASELVEVGGGTGFFVTADGYIVTNRHVVSDEGAVFTVVTNDGAELPATVVAIDPFLDIAVLHVQGDDFPVVELGHSDNVRIGQTVIAIGNTLSEFRNTVTKGVISGINRRVVAGDSFGDSDVIERAIQTDAAINPGNSGGPLINLLGQVIGVNTAMSFEGESIGFAIPIDDVRKIVDDIRQYGRIIRPWLGVRYVLVTEEIAKEEGLSQTQGALIVKGAYDDEVAVFEGSPADLAGLQEGDIILSVEGEEIVPESSLSQILSAFQPGDVITLMIARGDEIFPVDVELVELDPNQFN